MELWIKIAVILFIATLVYREIIKSATQHSKRPIQKTKASFMSLLSIAGIVGLFTYAGMSITLIETRDLRPYSHPSLSSPQFVSLYDKGVIEFNGMVIKTNLAREEELAPLAERLTQGCNGDDGCEAQKLFDYVTAIPYRTDYTSRNALTVVKSNWGDCDDKSNLFASLLNERGLEYRFVYVPHHVFVAVHLNDTKNIPFLNAKLTMEGKNFYYAETTASRAKIGEFNGQFPYSFEGIYDIQKNRPEELSNVKFSLG
ncbi:transglutaminase family protein [Sulfuricurvum sp.]|uniref:transglutaminase-like domain-containing protein n=1 Tax=Sulfuricurvum sp. TaxID=2025608 RepID=UPI00356B5B8B